MIDAADQAGGGFSIKWSVTFPQGYFAHRVMAENGGVTEPICLPWKSLETLTADITPVMHDAWWRRNSLDTAEKKNKPHAQISWGLRYNQSERWKVDIDQS